MPTDAEIAAAEAAVNVQRYHRYHTNRDIALAALAAAEAVRVKANECHALDRNHVGLCECPICRAYRAGRSDAAFIAAHMPDQRMTQTHAPLASHVQWSQPGDPASYDPIAKAWHPAVMAALSEAPKLETWPGYPSTPGQAAALRAAEADANHRATLTGGQTHPSTQPQPPPTSAPPTHHNETCTCDQCRTHRLATTTAGLPRG